MRTGKGRRPASPPVTRLVRRPGTRLGTRLGTRPGTRLGPGLAAALLVAPIPLAGCGAAPEASPRRGVSATSAPSPSSTAATTVLDGTWAAHITEEAFVGYAVAQGVRRRDVGAMVERDLPGPEFSLRLLEGRFNVTGPDGSSWHSGWFEVRDDRLLLREAPDFPPFRLVFDLQAEQLTLRVAKGQEPGPEHLPGIPSLVAGGALYCSVPWTRVAEGA
jgi:hypothetical protein